MIQSFANQGTRDIWNDDNTKRARRTCPREIWSTAQRKLDHLDSADELNDLGRIPSNELEALKGDRAGQHSIRINRQYRICFRWTPNGPADVEIVDEH